MNVNRKNDSMKKILVWGLLAVLGMACYDDLGNYDYNDINDMVLEMPRSVSVTIPKKDSVLVEVKAAVTQLDRKDNANLTYLWKKNLSGVTWTECGTDSVCRIWVYPKNSGQITLRLAVTDTVQNIVTFGETVVNLVAAFNRCWFVLQNIGENAVLGCIDGQKLFSFFRYFSNCKRSASVSVKTVIKRSNVDAYYVAFGNSLFMTRNTVNNLVIN